MSVKPAPADAKTTPQTVTQTAYQFVRIWLMPVLRMIAPPEASLPWEARASNSNMPQFVS